MPSQITASALSVLAPRAAALTRKLARVFRVLCLMVVREKWVF